MNYLGESSGGIAVGFHLLSNKSNMLINAAISQSGAPLFDFSSQQSDHANEAIVTLCETVNNWGNNCEPGQSNKETVDSLRLQNAVDLQLVSRSMCYSNDSYPDYPIWAPVKHDGVFFDQVCG